MIVLKVLSCILFNTTDAVSAAGTILFIAGLCRIFVKFGEKGWKALIPCYRLYVLGECVGRVMEGRPAKLPMTMWLSAIRYSSLSSLVV